MSNDFWSVMNHNTLPTNSINSSSTAGARGTDDNSALDKTAFMQLLLAQMQNQDPLSPMDTQDYFAQLAQFSMLEQMWTMNESLAQMQSQQQILDGSALIGRTVEYNAGDGSTLTGHVDGLQVYGGSIYLDVEGIQVPLENIVAVSE